MKPDYCGNKSVESCDECSLVKYGKDCRTTPPQIDAFKKNPLLAIATINEEIEKGNLEIIKDENGNWQVVETEKTD